MKNPLGEFYILIGIFLAGVIILLGLYFGNVGIYGHPYLFIDPRTGDSVSRTEWRNPDINYSPYLTEEPTLGNQALDANLVAALNGNRS